MSQHVISITPLLESVERGKLTQSGCGKEIQTVFLPRCLRERTPGAPTAWTQNRIFVPAAPAGMRAGFVGSQEPWRMRRVPLCLPLCRRIVLNNVHMCSLIADTSSPTHNLDAVRRGHAWRLLWLPTNPAIRAAQCSIQGLQTISRPFSPRARLIQMPQACRPL